MAVPDIKDVGTLAGFVVWGWPWHGLVTRDPVDSLGTIGTTGVSHPVPEAVDMTPWLIDMGLPAIELSAAETAYAAANNQEWRNYALIPGGYVYGTHIGAQSYIHIDDVNDCWRVALSYSWPATDTIRITATIDRFGLFQRDTDAVPAAVVKTADVVCELIDPTTASGGLTGLYAYTTNSGNLEDVYTNGAKALVGVFLHDGLSNKDMFSLIDVVLTGTGGTDGSTLSLSASEIKGQSDLTVSVIGNSTFARYGFYSTAGAAVAVRLSVGGTPYVENFRRILENDTVIDHLTFTNDAGGVIVTGSLASNFSPLTGGSAEFSTLTPFVDAFRNTAQYNFYCCSRVYDVALTDFYLGIHRMSSKATAFFFWDGTATPKIYGIASTPVGPVTPAIAADAENNFAFQRKTGAYTFANDLICYV